MNDKKKNFLHDVLLTFQTSLLGMVIPTLRGVTVGCNSEKIIANFYYDGEIGDEEEEISSDVEAEMIACFPDQTIEINTFRVDSPKNLNDKTLQSWIYFRKE